MKHVALISNTLKNHFHQTCLLYRFVVGGTLFVHRCFVRFLNTCIVKFVSEDSCYPDLMFNILSGTGLSFLYPLDPWRDIMLSTAQFILTPHKMVPGTNASYPMCLSKLNRVERTFSNKAISDRRCFLLELHTI